MSGLFEANGRDDLIYQAIDIMLSNTETFLFGTGINSPDLGSNSQHNMFLEFWVLNGTILMIPFLAAVLAIIWCTKKKKNKYLLWQLLLAHQFFSSFFATTFMPVVVILALASANDNNFGKIKADNLLKTG